MQPGGAIIGGRYYTGHALERMAPNTPQVRAELNTRAFEQADTRGLMLGTREYSDFVNRQVDPRGIPPMAVDSTIRNTVPTPGNSPGTFVHQAPGITVIVNEWGDILTAY